jgi:hypothetical protein
VNAVRAFLNPGEFSERGLEADCRAAAHAASRLGTVAAGLRPALTGADFPPLFCVICRD